MALLPNNSNTEELISVASAIWELPAEDDDVDIFPKRLPLSANDITMRMLSAPDPSCFKFINITRAIDFDHQFTVATQKYLDDIYADENQLYLASLGTHPDHQRRGAGGALVMEGLGLGKRAYGNVNVTATLIATEMGEPLYAHLGWESLHNFTVKSLDVVDGRREEWRWDVMKYEF